jgi:hypothetical protein
MTALGKPVGIRTQAILTYLVVASWYWSYWLISGLGGKHSVFCGLVLLSFPFLATFFTLTLLASYFRSGHPHFWWVTVAVIATASTWILLLLMGLSLRVGH